MERKEEMMDPNELRFLIAARQASVVKLKGFAGGTTPKEVADLLWHELGWNVPEHCVTISPHTSPHVTVILTRSACADFLQRQLNAAGKQIFVEPSSFGYKKGKDNGNRKTSSSHSDR